MSSSEIGRLAAAIFSVLALVGGAVWWLVKWHLTNLHRRIRTLEKKGEELERDKQVLQGKLQREENHNRHLEQQVGSFTGQVEMLNAQVAHESEILSGFRSENAEVRAERSSLQGQVASLTMQQKHQETQLASVTHERDVLRRDRESLQQQLRNSQSDLTGQHQLVVRLREQVQVQQHRVDELSQVLHTRIEEYQDCVESLEEKNRELERKLSQQSAQATEELEKLKEEATEAQATAQQLNDQIDRVINQDERVWERSVNGVPFQPLSIRNVPIIAVLNLKGGVGKTTITANLAGLMVEQGKKVLVIDADYQRNLSMLLFSDNARKMLHLQGQTLQHFLTGKNHTLATFLTTVGDVNGDGQFLAVTNSDKIRRPIADPSLLDDSSLEDAEMRLMADWMFRPDGSDVRLFVREALHDLNLQAGGFEYVLIDCPPRLSTACVNALAASDFVLVPVLPDATSARSVPNLLRTLSRLRSDSIFPHLSVLGVVANGVKFRADKPIAQQSETWSELTIPCRVAWGGDVHQFKTKIPLSQRFADFAGSVTSTDDGPKLAIGEPEIKAIFRKLLNEMETRIENERPRLAALLAQSGHRPGSDGQPVGSSG
jgi:cellulose biosynthesis protein BcsQ